MAEFERSVLVDAPLETVWEFHSTVDGLLELTPSWLSPTIVAVRGPDGRPNPAVLEVGTEITIGVRPLGRLPGGTWTARITDRRVGDDHAVFRDEMVAGPFEHWEHTHRFTRVGTRTRIVDAVAYTAPVAAASPLVGPVLTLFFWYRHRRTRAVLED